MAIDLKSLFSTHEREVGLFLRRKVGASGDAADLSQETFLRIARLPDTDAVEDPRRFLFTIATNIARDHLRRFVRRQRTDAGPPGEDLACPLATPEESLYAIQQQGLLRDAIESLPERMRAIFLLHHVEGRSYRDIGQELGLSARTVEYRLGQALTHCREHVRKAGALGPSA